MSDKSKLLNKLIIFILLLEFSGCAFIEKDAIRNTEIICPDGKITLVKFIRAKELKRAILQALKEKKRLKTSEKYTVVRLQDGRSFILKGVPPEVAASCDLKESKLGEVEPTYIHHF